MLKNVKIIEIGPRLRVAIERQSFTTCEFLMFEIHLLIWATLGRYEYSSGPNKRVHTPIYFRKKIPPHMALLVTTRILIFQRKSRKKLFQKIFSGLKLL